ncbi:MAG TPA: hypothetical protein VGN16_09760 [Acidobacteriaceae bacterium]|jgi:hypothetical protein
MNSASFWMVLADNSTTTMIRHSTFDKAKAEASRLATKHPGIRFYVLGSQGHCVREEPVCWTPHIGFDEIPF